MIFDFELSAEEWASVAVATTLAGETTPGLHRAIVALQRGQ